MFTKKKWTIFKSRLLGHVAYIAISILRATWRVKVIKSEGYQPEKQFLFAFWHGKQLFPVVELVQHKTKRAVLISPSRDGEILSTWLIHLGYEIIRGSSRQDTVQAFRAMMRKIKNGYSLGFGIDGPIGPIYKVKPGMTYMAQKFKIGIIPVGSAFSHKWVFEKAWDKYEIPKPFSKAIFYIGEPIYIDQGIDLEISNQRLETEIKKAEAEAFALL